MIGLCLKNRYRLDAELGRGGLGVIFRAYDLLLDRAVAVKVLGEGGVGTSGRSRLLSEARSAAKLNHPNIVSIYDVGEDLPSEDGEKPLSFIVMELVEGASLEDLHLTLEEVLRIGVQVCAALEHAHSQGIIHRDLKPENVLLGGDGTAKLTDFGLARSVASRLTQEGILIGTVFYMSPELLQGHEIDARTDLYALGVMLYELAAGRLPFQADDPLAVISQHLYSPVVPPSTYKPDVSPGLDKLILRLLSKKPEDRPASALEVGQTLEAVLLLDGESSESYPALSPLEQIVRGRLIAREQELTQARQLWNRVVDGTALNSILLIAGEAGTGKTPLVREVRTLAEVTGARVISSECYPEGSAPYTPIANLVRDVLSKQTLQLPDMVMADLLTLVPDLAALYPNLRPNTSLDPRAEQQRLFDSISAMFSTLAARSSLLLIVEDVQWADAGTLFFLRHLARRSRSARLNLLILLTLRQDEVEQGSPLNDMLFDLNRERLIERITLERYNYEQTREVLETMFQQDISTHFLEMIYRATEGNLFFIEEMCKALIDEGKLYRDSCEWRWPEDLAEINLPQSVRMTIQARVSKLPIPAQDLLRHAAVIGREFDFQTLSVASGLDEEQLIDLLELAERAQLIDEVQAKFTGNGRVVFAFVHGLIPATLRENMSSLRRSRLHRRIAVAVESLHPDDYEGLAYHYQQGGDTDKAVDYYLQAGFRARAVFANADAVRFYTQALSMLHEDLPRRFDALSARSDVYDLIGKRDSQRADVLEMMEIAERLKDEVRRCDAYTAVASYYLATDYHQAQSPAIHAVEVARKIGDPTRLGQTLRALGWCYWKLERPTESRQAMESAVEYFRQAGLPAEAADCLHTLSLIMGFQGFGDILQSRKYAEEAVRVSQQIGNKRLEADSLRRLAIVHMDQYKHKEALPHAEAALKLSRETGDREGECHALNVMGLITGWLNRPGEAEQYLLQSLHIAEDIFSASGIMIAANNLSWIYFRLQGEYERGLDFLNRMLSKPSLAQDDILYRSLTMLRVDMLYSIGQFEQALSMMNKMGPLQTKDVSKVFLTRMNLSVGLLEMELGNFERGLEKLDSILEQCNNIERPSDLTMVLMGRASASYIQGEPAGLKYGVELVERSIELLKDTEWRFDLANAYKIATWLYLSTGEYEKALDRASKAFQLSKTLPIPIEEFLYTYASALIALGQEEAALAHLRRAYEQVMAVYEKMRNPEFKQSWLEKVRINRMILSTWEQYGR